MKKKLAKMVSCLLCLAMLASMAAPAMAAIADEAAPEVFFEDLLDGEEIIFSPGDDDAVSLDAPAPEDDAASAVSVLPDGDAQVNPFAESGEYEIYPTPQSITYGGAGDLLTLPSPMKVIYGDGIDQYTKDRAVEALDQAGVTLSTTATSAAQLTVRIKAADETVTAATAGLFDKTSAYKLTIDASGITVVGKDTDAAFYGLTTVKRILQQVENKKVRHLTVEDYADVAFRGFIEGYYGQPWTTEDRAELMTYGGELKMNIYFYAPKNDPKHNSQWRELYTQAELDTLIQPLAEAGNKSKCYYGYALHPFMNNAISFASDEAYENDLNVLKAKFEQVMRAGVRQIAVLADDASVPTGGGASYVRLMKDLTDWVSSDEMQGKYPGLQTSIPFCPDDYMGNGSSDQLQALKALPASVPIIMTGGQVYGTVNPSFLNTFEGNMGRGAYLWINWPCSDNVRKRIMMLGQDKFLRTGVDPDTIEGIMLNPMQQSEASKVGIFCNADYAWNLWEDEAHGFQAWDDAFKYLENNSAIGSPAADALRRLSQHMGYNIDSRPPKTDESQEMWPLLSAFLDAMSSDTVTAEQIAELRTEYEQILSDVRLYKNKTTGNQRILGKRDPAGGYPKSQEQLLPWLDCAEDFAQANLDLLDTLDLILSNNDGANDNQIVEKYFSCQAELAASQSHDCWSRDGSGDFYITPEFGGQRLVPFADQLMDKVSAVAKTIIDPNPVDDPNALVETVITNRTDGGNLSPARDGLESTEVSFQSPNKISVDDYVGLKFDRSIRLTNVRFEVGRSENSNDTFNDSKLQYMDTNGSWKDIPGATFAHGDLSLKATGLDLIARGIRVIATSERTGTWLGIKEIYFNEPTKGEQLTGTVIKSSRWEVYEGPESNLTDNDDSTVVWYKETGDNKDKSLVGDYLGLDLGEVKYVGAVRFVVGNGEDADKWTNFQLQYSTDNKTWISAGDFSSSHNRDGIVADLGGAAARYVRFVNTVQVNKWLYFSELSVYASPVTVLDKMIYQGDTEDKSDAVKKMVNPVAALEDDFASLAADQVVLRPKEYVGIALPRIRAVTEIVANYTPVPGLVLKVGMSEADMRPVGGDVDAQTAQLFAADDDVIAYNGSARYIRLENTSEKDIVTQIKTLSVKSTEIGPVRYAEELSNMGVDSGYAYQDNRETVNFFDGDKTTGTTLAQKQTAGEYVTYDLGQLRPISKLTMAMPEGEKNYLRHGVLEVSPDGEDWTTVVTVDNNGAYNTAVKDGAASDPSYKLGVPEQNWVSFVGEVDTVQARYLRIRVTADAPAADGDRNFISAKEILINSENFGQFEYVRSVNDPTFDTDPIEPSADFTPDKTRDGDLNTGFKPNMTDAVNGGYFIYRLSENTSIGQVNVILSDTAGVKFSVRAAGETEFTDVKTLSGGLNKVEIPEAVADVAEIKLSWGKVTPTIYEIITVARDKVREGGQASSDTSTVPINSYAGDARTINFDENWKFNLGDASGASVAIFDDANWRTVNLPHDYSIEGEYTTRGDAESGYLIGGTGWYRKSFTVDSAWKNTKTVAIDFGGVYMDCEVYLNGDKLGEHHYGYSPFSFVLPADKLNYDGENVIAVKTNDAYPSSRWYSGAGIYRSVNLTVTNPVHVARYGTYVVPTKGSGDAWTVNIETNVQNDGASAANSVSVKQEIFKLNGSTFKPEGAAKGTATETATIAAGNSSTVEQTITVTNPDLWNSWDKGVPNLYVLRTTVTSGGKEDVYETEFGFREIDWTVDTGFKLNGQNVKLKGVCQHHDQGGLGAEAWYRALERQVDILMSMGVNAIRVTHNPAANELIEICNRKGVLIIDELFDGWAKPKNGNSNDFSRFFNDTLADHDGSNLVGGTADMKWQQFVTETVVNRDKNAPSVIMYSLCNEVQEGSGTDGNYATYAQEIIDWIQAIDDTRWVTRGDNNRTTSFDDEQGAITKAIHDAGGITGHNYHTVNGVLAGHNNSWRMLGSEATSHVNSRGIYNTKTPGTLNSDKVLTSYDKSSVHWGYTVSEGWWRTILYDYNGGEFVWTGFDYLGEPTPANNIGSGAVGTWPSPKNSYFGAIDTNGLPKDSYWLYRSLWNEKSHTLHILPTWDEEDLMIADDGTVEVVVYTDAPMVKLKLNGTVVGSATSTTHTTDAGHKYRTFNTGTGCFTLGTQTIHPSNNSVISSTGSTTLYATFNVPYDEGTLEAVACDANGDPLGADWTGNCEGRSVVKTTDGAKKLKVTADRSEILNDGRDLSYITIDIVDSKGEIVNGATNEISVSVKGDGVFMALDNGVQADHTSYQSNTRKAGAGRLVAIVQSTKDEGKFTLTATAQGLTLGAVTVKTSKAPVSQNSGPVSYDIAKTYYVQLNTMPDLPDDAVVTLGNGSTKRCRIAWDEIDEAALTQVGEFTVRGVIDPDGYAIPVSVGVVVLDDVVALLNYSDAVQVGVPPTLPQFRPAVMADGTVVNAQFAVTWTKPDDKVYDRAGTVVVKGDAKVFGKTLPVTATIRVATIEFDEGGNVSNVARHPTVNGVENADLGKAFLGTGSWTGSGRAMIDFDTAQNLYRIVLHYDSAVPTGANAPTITLGDGDVTVSGKVSGNTVTYELGATRSSETVVLNFPAEVTLSEVELITATPIFPVNAKAELDGVNVNGQPASDAQLAARKIRTPSLIGTVTTVSDANVAVTILPESPDGKIILVTESEDHATRDQYVVLLDAPEEITDATSSANDYPRTDTTATAPSAAATSGNNSASAAIDNNNTTVWHTSWSNQDAEYLTEHPEDRYIQLQLNDPTDLVALRYRSRSDGADTNKNGIITKYRVEVSSDGTNFTPVASGSWTDTRGEWKIAMFDKVANARYVRLYAEESISDQAGKTFVSASEIRLVKKAETTKADLSLATVTVEPGKFDWKNREITPGKGTEGAQVTVTMPGVSAPLVKGVDYELEYENNVDPGTAYIHAVAIGNKYFGAATGTFLIEKKDITITSFQQGQVRVQPGIDPTPDLPTTVLAFTDAGDNETMVVPVVWPEIDPEWYLFPKDKEQLLTGEVEDPDLLLADPDLKPKLLLKFAFSQSVETVSLVTPQGVVPELPSEVTVLFDDGTSAKRTVSKWYVQGHPDDELSAADFNTIDTVVTLEGTIVGIKRVKAVATVRVGANSGTEWVVGGPNIALNTNYQTKIFPMALSYWCSGDNNPYQALQANTPGNTTAAQRWSDWGRLPNDSYAYNTNPKAWLAVAFSTSTQIVTRQQSQTLTLEKKHVNKVEVMFVDEGGGPSGSVTFPQDYEIQYYTGPVANLTFDTRLSGGDEKHGSGTGNGRVRDWSGTNPLLDDSNWTTISQFTSTSNTTNNTAKPVVPSANGTWLTMEFADVETAMIRVLVTPKESKWTGIQMLRVYESVEKPIPPVAKDTFTAPTITVGGVEVDLSSFTEVTEGNFVYDYPALDVASSPTEGIPQMEITLKSEDNASFKVTQATRVPGQAQPGVCWAQATVTSEDGSTTHTYTVKFTRTGAPSAYFVSTTLDDNVKLYDASGKLVVGTASADTVLTFKADPGYEVTDVWVTIVDDPTRPGELVKVTNNSFTMPASNVDVRAKATPIQYKIYYNYMGGAITGTNLETYNTVTGIPRVINPVRPGYVFRGWVGTGILAGTTVMDIVVPGGAGHTGDRYYTAVWDSNGAIGGGGGNNGGSSLDLIIPPAQNTVTTTTDPDTGNTVVTTVTPAGVVTEVTTSPSGTQTAAIHLPQNSGSAVQAVMPAMDVTKSPYVVVQNGTQHPVALTVPIQGSGTTVAVRKEADGSETIIPMSLVDETGLRLRTQPGSQTIRLVDNAKTFLDVPDSHWASGSVAFASSRELFLGVGDNIFAPSLPMTRAMLTTVLWRLAEKPEADAKTLFSDVESGAYYEPAVAWGVENGVVKGTDVGFEPDAPVTRETLAVLLYRSAGSPTVVDEMPRRFPDGAQVSGWAHTAVVWCVENDILRGRDGNLLAPQDIATRAEVATMLQRFVDQQLD